VANLPSSECCGYSSANCTLPGLSI